MAAYAAELVRSRASSDDCPVVKMHIAGKLDGIGADYMVAENATVRGMAIGHEKAIRADDSLLSVLCSKMHGRELADNRAIADLDKMQRKVKEAGNDYTLNDYEGDDCPDTVPARMI